MSLWVLGYCMELYPRNVPVTKENTTCPYLALKSEVIRADNSGHLVLPRCRRTQSRSQSNTPLNYMSAFVKEYVVDLSVYVHNAIRRRT